VEIVLKFHVCIIVDQKVYFAENNLAYLLSYLVLLVHLLGRIFLNLIWPLWVCSSSFFSPVAYPSI